MYICTAKRADIKSVLELHYKYHIDSIREEDIKDGFVTTPFSKEDLLRLIRHKGLFIAKTYENKVIGYIMAASWDFWETWPMFKFMINDLKNTHYLNQVLTIENSYQYGPVCIDKTVRGTGILQNLFEYSRKIMSIKYPIIVTFINKNNHRSYAAHVKKLGFEVVREFEFNGNKYHKLVYDTSKKQYNKG